MSKRPNQTITLDVRAGYASAPALFQTLTDQRGTNIHIDAGSVEYIGVPCLEVLLSAAKSWQEASVEFQIVTPSDAFNEGIARLGISLSELGGTNEQTTN